MDVNMMTIGYRASGDGTLTQTGGTLNVLNGNLNIGWEGTGVLTQTAGAINQTGGARDLVIGRYASGNGTYNLGGGILETRNLSMGPGTAAFNFTGGALRVGTVAFSLNNQAGTLDVCTPMTAG